MAEDLNQEICKDSGFDFSTVPKLGPNLEGLGDDITDFLCNVLQVSRREDLDPVLREGAEYDNSVWISALTGMVGIGDPRFSMGELMTLGLEKYLKPLEIQLRILQEGCEVVNGVLCDSEGNEMPYYGKCDPPDLSLFSYDAITKFVVDLWNEKIKKHADDFITFLKDSYTSKQWNIAFFALGDGDLSKTRKGGNLPIFYAKLTKPGYDTKYYKYYFDQREYVAKAFDQTIKINKPRQMQRDFFTSLQKAEPIDFDLIETISGPMWPEEID